jgi:putative membrane protein
MEWLKALHVIAMVCWFAGLFYLPRLYVYHCSVQDNDGYWRFCTMEYKLYFYIMWPAALLTAAFGFALIHLDYATYSQAMWLHVKLTLALFLGIFHLALGKWFFAFRARRNLHTERFYRWMNEVPTIFLIAMVLLAFVKPWS